MIEERVEGIANPLQRRLLIWQSHNTPDEYMNNNLAPRSSCYSSRRIGIVMQRAPPPARGSSLPGKTATNFS